MFPADSSPAASIPRPTAAASQPLAEALRQALCLSHIQFCNASTVRSPLLRTTPSAVNPAAAALQLAVPAQLAGRHLWPDMLNVSPWDGFACCTPRGEGSLYPAPSSSPPLVREVMGELPESTMRWYCSLHKEQRS